MDALTAAKETMKLWASKQDVNDEFAPPEFGGDLSFSHCSEMLSKMNGFDGPFSYGKLCRWLGWIQAACVANGCGTLEEMKEINKRNA